MFKVEPVTAYPYNYRECCDAAKEELNNNIKRETKRELTSIADYDTIYIGGPVWLDHYPMPLLATLEKLDFSSKKVKPFTTHEGSGLGSVMSDVEKYCKNAIIESGLSIVGSNVNNAEEKLESWCK